MLQTKQRLTWLDIAKAITILLVVFGHTLRGGIAQKIVYAFHVATFFLLSGMTCKTDNLKIRIKNDILRILVPYYSFSICSILIFLLLGKFAAGKFDLEINNSLGYNLVGMLYGCPTRGGLKYNTPLWFLPCLFATKMVYYGLSKICREKPLPIFLCSLVLAAGSFVYTRLGGPGLPFNLSVSLKMLLFFSLGRIFFMWLPSVKESLKSGFLPIILGIIMLAVTGVVAVFSPKMDYASDTFPNIVTFLITTLLGSFGVCFLSMGIGKCKWIEYVGKTTLSILVMHKFPILVFQTIGPQKALLAQYNSPVGIGLAVVVSVVTIVLCLIADWIIRRWLPFLLGDFSRKSQTDSSAK